MLKLSAQDQLEYYKNGFGSNCSYEFPIFHTHDYWEFMYVRFDIEHIINGQTEHIPPHSVVIVRPSDEHLIRALPSNQNNAKAPTHLNIKIRRDTLKELLSQIDPDLYDKLLLTAPLSMNISNDSSAAVLEYFLTTLLWNTDEKANLSMLKTAVLLITGLFFRDIYSVRVSKLHCPDEVDKVIQKMNSRKYLNATIAEITSESNYSHMQLTRLFKQTTGITMQDYFLNIKYDYAAEQLRLTDRLIIDISNDIGIYSLSHFNHLFKKRFGIPPGKYRHDQQH